MFAMRREQLRSKLLNGTTPLELVSHYWRVNNMLTHSLLSCSFREHSFIVLTRRKNTRLNVGKSLFLFFNKFYQLAKYINIQRRSDIILSWFSCRFSILVELKFGDVGFCGGRKTGEPGQKPLEQGFNQQQTQPTYGTGPESNAGHIGGRRALSPLRHP